MTHAVRGCSEEQSERAYHGAHETDLPVREGLYHGPHEEAREVDDGVERAGDHGRTSRVHAQVVQQIFEEETERRLEGTC